MKDSVLFITNTSLAFQFLFHSYCHMTLLSGFFWFLQGINLQSTHSKQNSCFSLKIKRGCFFFSTIILHHCPITTLGIPAALAGRHHPQPLPSQLRASERSGSRLVRSCSSAFAYDGTRTQGSP